MGVMVLMASWARRRRGKNGKRERRRLRCNGREMKMKRKNGEEKENG